MRFPFFKRFTIFCEALLNMCEIVELDYLNNLTKTTCNQKKLAVISQNSTETKMEYKHKRTSSNGSISLDGLDLLLLAPDEDLNYKDLPPGSVELSGHSLNDDDYVYSDDDESIEDDRIATRCSKTSVDIQAMSRGNKCEVMRNQKQMIQVVLSSWPKKFEERNDRQELGVMMYHHRDHHSSSLKK